MEHSNDSGKVISALLIGAAIGGVLGILFAPAKGAVTRQKIAGNSDDLADAIKEKFEAFLEEIKKEAESMKEKGTDFAMDGRGK